MADKKKATSKQNKNQFVITFVIYETLGISQVQEAFIARVGQDVRITYKPGYIMNMPTIDLEYHADLKSAIKRAKIFCRPEDIHVIESSKDERSEWESESNHYYPRDTMIACHHCAYNPHGPYDPVDVCVKR